jgi:large subunit ribosomal protein L35
MPKQKTHRGARKRLKVTAGGLVSHRHAFRGHRMRNRNARRRRHLRRTGFLSGRDNQRMREIIRDT